MVCIFYEISQGADAYAAMQGAANFWLVKLIYWGFIFALFFHLCHGLRHLCWDLGEGFEASKLNKYAIIELAVAVLLTLATWIFI